jgi:hypothetical protein
MAEELVAFELEYDKHFIVDFSEMSRCGVFPIRLHNEIKEFLETCGNEYSIQEGWSYTRVRISKNESEGSSGMEVFIEFASLSDAVRFKMLFA